MRGWFSDPFLSWWKPRVGKYSALELFQEACIFVFLEKIFISEVFVDYFIQFLHKICIEKMYTSSSRSQMFFKTIVLKIVLMLKGEHLCWSFLFNKIEGLKACNLLKRDSNRGASLWILRNFLEQLLYRTPPAAAFRTPTSTISKFPETLGKH